MRLAGPMSSRRRAQIVDARRQSMPRPPRPARRRHRPVRRSRGTRAAADRREQQRIDQDLELACLAPRPATIGSIGHAGRGVVARLVERQRPEMRRRPEEDDGEQDEAVERHGAGDGGPADHRREGAGGAADDDVLRRPALQPHRVDDDVEEDREGEQRRRPDSWRQTPSISTEKQRQDEAEGKRLVGAGCGPSGIGRLRVRLITASMSASYHMLSAPEAPAPTAMASSDGAGRSRVDVAGRERPCRPGR